MHIPVKAGRLATGAYSSRSPISGSVFGNRPRDVSPFPEGQGLQMDEDRTATIYASPIADNHNVATQRTLAPRVIFYSQEVPVTAAPSIQPQDRGTFFRRSLLKPVNMVFGGSKDNPPDNAFHLKPEKKLPVPILRSAIDGAHVEAVSFPSRNNLWYDQNNSFLQGRATAGNPDRPGVGRWNIVKKGVV